MAIKSDPGKWKDARQVLGLEGEELAKTLLQRKGWRILEHRFRIGRVEVDIIARRGDVVAFVEVKTRWTRRFGDPVEAVTWRKRQEIARVAAAWMDRKGRGLNARFDVIGVQMHRGGRADLRHIEDAFRCGWR